MFWFHWLNKEVLDIALSQGYTREKSYQEAEARYKDLRNKEYQKMEKEEEDERKSKDQFLKELVLELKMLDSVAEMSFQELIEFLFENFPPKENAASPA